MGKQNNSIYKYLKSQGISLFSLYIFKVFTVLKVALIWQKKSPAMVTGPLKFKLPIQCVLNLLFKSNNKMSWGDANNGHGIGVEVGAGEF